MEAAQAIATAACQQCGASVPADLLVCPSCHALVHAQKLRELSQASASAQVNGAPDEAMRHLREMLELLPPGTKQYTTVQKRIAELSSVVGFEQVSRESMSRSHLGRWLATLGTAGVIVWKFKFLLVLVLTKGKLLLLGLTNATTFLSMFTFALAYWSVYRWPFAVGIALSIYVHEMGHVQALQSRGMKASVPMFIPGLGAVIRLKQHPASEIEDARIGLAGPLYGLFAAAACLAISLVTDSPMFAALAHVGALINIFNLIPIWSLDGSRGFRSLSRSQAWWVVGAIGAAWFVSSEGLLLLVAIVAMVRAIAKPPTQAGDRTGFALFLLLVAALSALTLVRAPIG